MNSLIQITKGSGKMEGICSINTNPLNNKFCEKMSKNPNLVCYKCYSRRCLQTYRKNCATAWDKNNALLKKMIPVEYLPTINEAFFRFNGHGELLNLSNLKNYYNTAKKNPNTLFALWTKRKELINKLNKPTNMILVYSNPTVDDPMTTPPTKFNKVFNVLSSDDPSINCGNKKCKDCRVCYSKNNVKVINEKIK